MIRFKSKASLRNKLIVYTNLVYLFIMVLIGFNYYFPHRFMSFFFILNVLYPYFLLGFLFFIILTILKKNKLLLTINLTIFLAIFFLLGPIYVFGDSTSEKTEGSIKVLTLNAFQFNGFKMWGETNLGQTFEKFIDANNPDIICLQEFSMTNKIPLIIKKYPYYYVNYITHFTKYSPLTIFSKYPIIAKGSLDFPNSGNNSIYVDIELPKDTLRVYNVHLQSLVIRPGSIKRERPYNLLNRIGSSYKLQLQQAKLVKEHYKNAPYKAILCGDFNNTQYSGIVRLFSEELKDSFIEKGNGFGSTYYFKFLPFRIDYIFTEKSLEIVDHQNFDIRLSDHYPIMATIKLGVH